jgi:hypothetical protein
MVHPPPCNTFRPTCRELQRLENVHNSPVFSHFDETLGGMSVVRAYGVGDQLRFEMRLRMDKWATVYQVLPISSKVG